MKDRTDTDFVETVFAKSISFRSGDIRSPNANNLMFVLILTNPVIQASSICKYGKFYKKHQNNMVKGDLQSIWMEMDSSLSTRTNLSSFDNLPRCLRAGHHEGPLDVGWVVFLTRLRPIVNWPININWPNLIRNIKDVIGISYYRRGTFNNIQCTIDQIIGGQ